jgi:hypothetical protein
MQEGHVQLRAMLMVCMHRAAAAAMQDKCAGAV